MAGKALKANLTALGPLVLPVSEQLLFAANLLGILSGVPITLAVCLPELRLKLWRSRLGLVKVHAHPDRHHAQIHDHRHAHPWRIVPMVEAAARSLP